MRYQSFKYKVEFAYVPTFFNDKPGASSQNLMHTQFIKFVHYAKDMSSVHVKTTKH